MIVRCLIRRWIALLLPVSLCLMPAAAAPRQSGNSGDRPTLGVWVAPGGPWGIWEKATGDPFPIRRIVCDLAELGVTDILFFEQCGRGGPFLHPTTVPGAAVEKRMKGRDYLEELLKETDGRKMNVWLAWTTPSGKYPGTDFSGLNHPALQKLYCDAIDEVGRRYGKHPALAGVMWHELDCTEAPDLHEDDLAEFGDYCLGAFGERYPGATMPAVDPSDKWWRRFFLYKCDVVNRFVDRAAEVARRHGLRTHFCSYAPEPYAREGWRWGYDIVALEKICDRQWFSGYGIESGKPYQTIRGAWIDFGPSYKNQILARNFTLAFHGRSLASFSIPSRFTSPRPANTTPHTNRSARSTAISTPVTPDSPPKRSTCSSGKRT